MRNLLLAAFAASFLASPAFAATASNPAVVELFTSQGCSSCPPANANLIELSKRPDVLALSFDVTYWDYLGWKDTFDSEAYTQRQRDYEPPLGENGPFTPQIVVDGSKDAVGNVRSDVETLIAASRRSAAPSIQILGNAATVSAGSGHGDVWLVRYDPRVVQVPIARGENSGTTQPQVNVVHALVNLGDWKGAQKTFTLPADQPGLKSAILVQQGSGGPIISAART